MTVFHGSICEVRTPDLSRSKKNIDLGPGFYVTTIRHQAERWAKRKSARLGGEAVVTEFNMLDDWSEYRVKTFPAASVEWLDFVCQSADCHKQRVRHRRTPVVHSVVCGSGVNHDRCIGYIQAGIGRRNNLKVGGSPSHRIVGRDGHLLPQQTCGTSRQWRFRHPIPFRRLSCRRPYRKRA